MNNSTDYKEPLARDAAGNYILDAPAKALLLGAMHRGAITEGELELLLDRAGRTGIRIIDTRPKPTLIKCDIGRAALESVCSGCGLATSCANWRERDTD